MGGCMEDTYQYCVPEANEDMNVRGVARVAYGTVKRRALALAVVVVSGFAKKQTYDLRFGGRGDAKHYCRGRFGASTSARWRPLGRMDWRVRCWLPDSRLGWTDPWTKRWCVARIHLASARFPNECVHLAVGGCETLPRRS